MAYVACTVYAASYMAFSFHLLTKRRLGIGLLYQRTFPFIRTFNDLKRKRYTSDIIERTSPIVSSTIEWPVSVIVSLRIACR